MVPIPPITNSILGSAGAQRVQADDKAAQARREAVRRNSGASSYQSDSYEPQVQSPHELEPVSDQPHQYRRGRQLPRRRPPSPPVRPADDGDNPPLDVTA